MGTVTLLRRLQTATALTPVVLASISATLPAAANPLDGNVVAGEATITNPDPVTLQVDQNTDKAIIEWKSFDIDAGETTVFNQPSTKAWTLNRVVGSQDPSRIYGSIKANGNIVIVNPDGIHFGAGSSVDVNRLIATTSDTTNDNFLSGNFHFDQPGNPSASIVNEGNISIADYGLAALVAPSVRNAGVISARLGQISLASGNQFTIDPYGDGLVKLAIDDEIAAEVIDVATGQPVADLVENEGTLSANGGVVALSAATARRAVNSVVNNTGVIEANSVGVRGGKIILSARTSGNKTSRAPTQVVRVSGLLSAMSVDDIPIPTSAPRGHIEITGEVILATNATIDASGTYGGGSILIGGDYLGGNADQATLDEYGIGYEDHDVSTADLMMLDETVSIHADASDIGDGGKVVVWSDSSTITAAEITARGGPNGGNGGFIETSGKYLDVRVAADASAENGGAGTWLLDPYDFYIRNTNTESGYNSNYIDITGFTGTRFYAYQTSSVISTDTIETALNAGNNIQITNREFATGSEAGHIYIEDDIFKTAGGDVTFLINAAGNIIIEDNVDIRSYVGALDLGLYATDGQIIGKNVGRIDTNGGQFTLGAPDGVTFKSDRNMPDHFILNLFPNGGSSLSTVYYDITFDDDVIKFSHDNDTATIKKGGLRLIDSGGGAFSVYADDLNVALYDNAVKIEDQRSWSVSTTAAIGALDRDALNGEAEIVSDGFVYLPERSVTVAGITTVVEVDAANVINSNSSVCYDLTCIVTGPSGEDVLDEYVNPGAYEERQALLDAAAALQAALDENSGAEGGNCSFDDATCKVAGVPVLTWANSPQNTSPIISDISYSVTKNADADAGEISGKLTFTYKGKTETIESISNGERDGDPYSPMQCVDLLKEYALALGYVSDVNEKSLGHGNAAAAGFARITGGEFDYLSQTSNSLSYTDLPQTGAVLSLAAWDGNEFGHVGIVASTSPAEVGPNDTTYSVKLFDQNWGSNEWKTVTFTKAVDETWSGSMPNTPEGQATFLVPVEGWANPTDS